MSSKKYLVTYTARGVSIPVICRAGGHLNGATFMTEGEANHRICFAEDATGTYQVFEVTERKIETKRVIV